MKQVTVRRVHFDDVEAGVERATCRVAKRVHDGGDLRCIERARHGVTVSERLGGRTDRLPASIRT